MFSSSESWELQQHPRLWHSRAGGGAVHSINSGDQARYSITSYELLLNNSTAVSASRYVYRPAVVHRGANDGPPRSPLRALGWTAKPPRLALMPSLGATLKLLASLRFQ